MIETSLNETLKLVTRTRSNLQSPASSPKPYDIHQRAARTETLINPEQEKHE